MTVLSRFRFIRFTIANHDSILSLMNTPVACPSIDACAKINIGLHVVERRKDGYHDLDTVFFPIPLFDRLEVRVCESSDENAGPPSCRLKISGIAVDGATDDNLVVRAYGLLRETFDLPSVEVHLYKAIPTQAGMGGGSSDAAHTLVLLNRMFGLRLTDDELIGHAARLGADCAFFIKSVPSHAAGIGDILTPLPHLSRRLAGLTLAVVKPPVAVSTKEAYAGVTPHRPAMTCREAVELPFGQWKGVLENAFEKTVFERYPQVGRIKQALETQGALFASMSGSGSAVFGLFDRRPDMTLEAYAQCQTFLLPL